jgi:hypothetical protein
VKQQEKVLLWPHSWIGWLGHTPETWRVAAAKRNCAENPRDEISAPLTASQISRPAQNVSPMGQPVRAYLVL